MKVLLLILYLTNSISSMISVLKSSRWIWVIVISAGVIAAVATTLVSWKVTVIAAPTFVSGKLTVVRVNEQAPSITDSVTKAQYLHLNETVINSNPKLKDAFAGADERYEILARAPGYSVPTMAGECVELNEGEMIALRSSLVLARENQEIQDVTIGQYYYSYVEIDGKFYNLAITTVGTP